MSLNKPLATGYYMKGDLSLFWNQPDKAAAEAHRDDWIVRAPAPGIRILKDFAKTLRTHRTGIPAYFDRPSPTGPLEATDNKIRTIVARQFSAAA